MLKTHSAERWLLGLAFQLEFALAEEGWSATNTIAEFMEEGVNVSPGKNFVSSDGGLSMQYIQNKKLMEFKDEAEAVSLVLQKLKKMDREAHSIVYHKFFSQPGKEISDYYGVLDLKISERQWQERLLRGLNFIEGVRIGHELFRDRDLLAFDRRAQFSSGGLGS